MVTTVLNSNNLHVGTQTHLRQGLQRHTMAAFYRLICEAAKLCCGLGYSGKPARRGAIKKSIYFKSATGLYKLVFAVQLMAKTLLLKAFALIKSGKYLQFCCLSAS